MCERGWFEIRMQCILKFVIIYYYRVIKQKNIDIVIPKVDLLILHSVVFIVDVIYLTEYSLTLSLSLAFGFVKSACVVCVRERCVVCVCIVCILVSVQYISQ